uniref:Uncharacterized protein n=1 Tax=Mola mola TaxID=94237 RepID=A0A3Q3X0U4_MOLML
DSEVMESAKALLDAGQEVPSSLMAKVLKFQLLQIKASDQQRRKAEQLEKGIQIFEGVAFLIYDCLEWQRQHQHYLASLRLIRVPTVVGPPPQRAQVCSWQLVPVTWQEHQAPSGLLSAPTGGVDMRYYSSLLDRVPLEACSVPLLLHCLLEQVCVCLVSFMLHNFLPLVYKEEERSHLIKSVLSMAESENDLEVCDSHNSHICGFIFGSFSWWCCLADVVSWLEVERLFHQSVFESMPLSGPDQTGVLVDAANTAAVIPWDNPLSYARQQLHLLRSKGFGKKAKGKRVDTTAKTPVESVTDTAPPVEETTKLQPTEESFSVKVHDFNINRGEHKHSVHPGDQSVCVCVFRATAQVDG